MIYACHNIRVTICRTVSNFLDVCLTHVTYLCRVVYFLKRTLISTFLAGRNFNQKKISLQLKSFFVLLSILNLTFLNICVSDKTGHSE